MVSFSEDFDRSDVTANFGEDVSLGQNTWHVLNDGTGVFSNTFSKTDVGGLSFYYGGASLLVGAGDQDLTVTVAAASTGVSTNQSGAFDLGLRVSDNEFGAGWDWFISGDFNDGLWRYELRLITAEQTFTMNDFTTSFMVGSTVDVDDVLNFNVSGQGTATTATVKQNGVTLLAVDYADMVTAGASEDDLLDGEYVVLTVGQQVANACRLDSFTATADVTPPLGTMFLPPSFGRIPTTVPKGFPQYDGVSNALMRNYRPRQEGTNVYYTSEGEVTETDPDSVNLFWDKTQGTPYVVYTFWGSTDAPYEVTTAQAQALSDAGYTLT